MSVKDLYKIFKSSSGISTDSREELKNRIYFALKGERFNGNNYVMEALERGAALAISSEANYEGNARVWVVQDPLHLLQELSAFHRKSWGGKVLAITGSNGKTTTKELIAAVLLKKFNLIATQGNLNNHIGVPLTLLGIKDQDFAVIEMGANHQGEIKLLSEIADPDYGLITNIGKAHLEGFGGIEGVKKGKGELYDHLASKGRYAFVNGNDEVLLKMVSQRNLNAVKYSPELNDDTRIIAEAVTPGIKLKLESKDKCIPVRSSLYGDYNLSNIVAAICVGVHFKVDTADIADAIESYVPQNNRSQILKGEKNTVILDAYNANPSSMALALEDFTARKHSGKKLVILGDMLELGEDSKEEHMKVLDFLSSHHLEAILVGENFYRLSNELKNKFQFFQNIEECITYLKVNPIRDSVILFKGSRKIMLEKATNFIL